MTNSIPEPRHILAPKDGPVVLMAQATVSDAELAEARESILQQLHTTYVNLLADMEEFQTQWDSSPKLAFLDAAWEGMRAGGSDWGKSIGELFEKETWVAIGDKIAKFAGSAYDTGAQHATEQLERIQAAVAGGWDLVDEDDVTLTNWAWWQANIDSSMDEAWRALDARVQAGVAAVEEAKASVIDSAEMGAKLWKHHDAILHLPILVSEGDVKGIQHFVDNELMDIDPELARQIKADPRFHEVIEIIQDHDSALLYAAYIGLIVEAIPPNFYAYCTVKYGVQLLLELVLTLVLALLSAGVGVAARVAALGARLLAGSARVAGAMRRVKKAQRAIEAFVRVFEDFADAGRQLRALGDKLSRSHRGYVSRGNTRETLTLKKQLIKRDKKCRLCGSTEHTTPRWKLGKVTYE
jgi:hypothetical protein